MNESMAREDEDNHQAARVHVRQIVIEGLFGQYTHRIPLAEKGGVAILHGRNGVGKTISLNMIAELLSGDQNRFERLANWPFKTMRIEFTDKTFVEARPHVPQESRGKLRRMGRKAGPEREIQLSYSDWPDSPASIITSSIPKTFTSSILNALVPFFDLVGRIPVHYVDTHRLHREERQDEYGMPMSVSAMDKIRDDMIYRINAVDAAYRETSAELDDSFATRLFASPSDTETIDSADLEARNHALEQERNRLREIGLLAESKSSFQPGNLDKTKQAMFAVYLEDNEKKLAVFKDLADRAKILLDILNSKFAPKRVRLDSEAGYRVESHDGQTVALNWLSSGEQHEFVLLHNLLFHVEPGSLLLIDEPEISLHVTWQNEFIADLVRIAKMIGFDALVATHSPYIVGTRRDLLVQLGAPE